MFKAKRIASVGENDARLVDREIDLDDLSDNEIALRNLVSTISNGTERANITGERVGNGPVTFPRCSGYSNCCEVMKAGEDEKTV